MNNFPLKSLLLISVFGLLMAGSAAAQQNRGDRSDRGEHHGPPSAEMRVAHMSSMLDLSDEQSAELLQIMQAVDLERDALHQKAMQFMEPDICDLQLRTETNLANVLTQEQLALMEELRIQRRHNRSNSGWRGMDNLDCSAYQ